MKNKNLLTLVLLVCFDTFCGFAQEHTFYHYGLEDGLSQITVRSLLKDSNGFLWLGTQDGLNRFDGTSFKVYKNRKNDSLSISGNFINALVEDNKGNIWIGTNDNGISIYDSGTNTFKSTDINSGYCGSLSKSENGTIVATAPNKGIILFDTNSYGSNPKIISDIRGEKLQFNTSFIENETLYVSTQDGRLFLSRNVLDANILFEEIPLKNKPFGTINTLFVKKQGIWLGTSNGLFRYDTITKTHKKIPLESSIEGNQNLYVSSIDVQNNRFYIGTFGGLFIANEFNPNTQKFKDIITFKGEQNQTNALTANRVYDTYTDGDLLLIGTNKLDVVTLKPPVFQNVNTLSSITLNNAFILSFAKNKNYVFVGTRKGINCIDSKNEVSYITQENTNQALAFNVIRAMAIDHNNYLWVATIKGVSVIDLNNFDPNMPKILSTFHDTNNPESLSSDATRGVFVDHNGSVWIMTYGGGINRFTGNLKTGTFTFKHYKTYTNLNSISSDFTYNMSQDRDLNYWITSEDGLNKLRFEDANYQNPKFTNYFNTKNDTTSISSNTTLHTWHDENQTLWVATQDGFNRFNSENQTFRRYGKAEGLTNTFVYSITEDLDNNLWLTTNGGLFRFNKNTEQFTNYDQGDGLQSSEFNLGAHLYNTDDNTIYVGGVNGFNIFNPRKVSELDRAGNLSFTSIRIKDKEINPLTNPEILKETITKAKEIVLNHTDFPCYINFSDLDLRPNKNNQFAYSLNDNQWNELRNSREIPLLSLPKGLHTLKIQGKSRNEVWDKPSLSLRIKVIPPWYQSNTAYLFYILVGLGLVYLFFSFEPATAIGRTRKQAIART
ncbi:MAG: two-component regulator propeller domain-containing protein [Psychroserpens sp.]|uniref:ligand-binding sensor domain-containing protein n=1 Tax=Psychroserpens sp. TaxID=2020870 RepID=UPI003C785804